MRHNAFMFVAPTGCNLSYRAAFSDPTKVPDINSVAVQHDVRDGSEAEYRSALGAGADVASDKFGRQGRFVGTLTQAQIAAYDALVASLESRMRTNAALRRYGSPTVASSKLRAMFASATEAYYVLDLYVYEAPRAYGTHVRCWCVVGAGDISVQSAALIGRFTSDAVLLTGLDDSYSAFMPLYKGRDADGIMP